jgi:triacylglycerol lipase
MNTVYSVPKLRAPIVLVHGLFGFDALRIFQVEVFPYFRGIEWILRRSKNRVYTARLSPTSRVKHRANELKRFLDKRVGIEPVHLIAHSMGGLDSRYMISKLGGGERVLTLTTLGTPHHGTSFADWGMTRWGVILRPTNLPFIRPVPALLDLTTEACRQFNATVFDDPRVRYFSVGGRYACKWWLPNWWFSSQVIEKHEGENDGLVSLASARYGEAFDVWEGDHLSLVNWPTVEFMTGLRWPDRRPAYAKIVQRLKELGY